jgi:hypothetical protein
MTYKISQIKKGIKMKENKTKAKMVQLVMNSETGIFIFPENGKMFQIMDLSEEDPQDKYFFRDLAEFLTLSDRIFDTIQKYDIVENINIKHSSTLSMFGFLNNYSYENLSELK